MACETMKTVSSSVHGNHHIHYVPVTMPANAHKGPVLVRDESFEAVGGTVASAT